MAINKTLVPYSILLALLSPALALYVGIKSNSKQILRWSIFLFTVFYASVMDLSFMGDGTRHYERVENHYVGLDFSTFITELYAILTFRPLPTTNDDVYIHLLGFFVGTILNAPGLFFVFVAIVYGYFYSGVIIRLLEYFNYKSSYNKFFVLFFALAFLLWKAPGSLQTVRTWTGMWVLLYAVLSYFQTKKKKYLFLALIPPFIHIGFFALALPFWFVLFTGYRNPKIYFMVFLLSTAGANIIQPTAVTETISQTEVGASKVRGYYVDDERAEEREKKLQEGAQNQRFYKTYQKFRIHYRLLTGLVIFIFLVSLRNKFNSVENMLFSYALAAASFANFFVFLFAAYNRAWQIAGVLILALMTIFLSGRKFGASIKNFFYIKTPLFVFFILFIPYMLYLLSDFVHKTSAYTLFTPFVYWINSDMAINIRGLILEIIR